MACPYWLKMNNYRIKNYNQLDELVKIFRSPYELAEIFAEELTNRIKEAEKRQYPLIIALPGGSTPELLFSLLGDHFSRSANWKYVHFFWGDERCVPPDHQESNYGMTRRKLLEKIDIPLSNIHRIRGEMDSEKEASRYSKDISSNALERDGLPIFDMIILGLGEDGHTASIFPGNKELLNSNKICEVAVHPVSLQKRITLTGRVINNADSVVFLVTGKKKAEVVEKILSKRQSAQNFPAFHINPVYGQISWFLDEEAGGLL
jgi:6-phosphogluconolactonase